MGGAVAAIESGYMQTEIQEAAVTQQQEIESGKRVVVGVNRYALDEEAPVELLRIDPALEQKQIESVQAVRGRRDSSAVEQALAQLKRASEGDANLMEPIMDASRLYVTMGEMCDALRDVWGVWRETPVF